MKKIWIIIIIVLSLILGLSLFNRDKVVLNLNNSTNKEIDYLKLKYTGIKEDTNIPIIKPNENIKFKVNMDKSFKEGSMDIYYLDKNNEEKKFTIIGYFQKGDKKIVNINIIDKDGNIDILSD